MRLIDTDKKLTTHERTEFGGITYTDHHDGSRDATVKIKSLKLNVTADAPPNMQLVAAIHELEEANREHRMAKHADSPSWLRYTTARLEAANLRVQEVQ